MIGFGIVCLELMYLYNFRYILFEDSSIMSLSYYVKLNLIILLDSFDKKICKQFQYTPNMFLILIIVLFD